MNIAVLKVNNKGELVIPREIVEKARMTEGASVVAVLIGDSIEIVPDRDLASMKGIFPGISLEGIREEEDRDLEDCA